MTTKKRIHFRISERKIFLRIFDIVFILLGLYITAKLFSLDYFYLSKDNWIWPLVLITYISIFGTIFELYDLPKASKPDVIFKNVIITTSFITLLYLFTPKLTPSLPENRLQIVYFYLIILLCLLIWRMIYVYAIKSPRFYKHALIIGEINEIESIVKSIHNIDPNYKIIGYIKDKEEERETIKYNKLEEFNLNEIRDVISSHAVTEIIVAIDSPNNITSNVFEELTKLLDSGFVIREYVQLFEELTKRVPVQFIGKDFYRYFPFSKSHHNKLYLFFKKLLDVLLSIIGILLMLLLIPLILFFNMFGNKGPLFYKQERCGQYGKSFNIIKFRTMIKDAEKHGEKWAQKNDIRITPFGKLLRKTRIDEYPQFINILKGDMSIIGPRPERPFFVQKLAESIPFYQTRHAIKPGITGWAQVNTGYGITIQDSLKKLQYDLYYIKHRNVFLDFKIIVKTLSTIIYYRGQ